MDEEEREVNMIGAGKILKKTASDPKDAGLDQSGGDLQVTTNLNSSKDFNKASGSPLRGAKVGSKARGLKKFGDDVKASQSPGKDAKKKKKGPGGVDKETRDVLKTLENKIDDLRKQSMGEINRLEAKSENEANDLKLHVSNI